MNITRLLALISLLLLPARAGECPSGGSVVQLKFERDAGLLYASRHAAPIFISTI